MDARRQLVTTLFHAPRALIGMLHAGLVTHGDVGRSIERGIVSASLAIEAWGARGLMVASPAAAEDRRARWFTAMPAEVSA
jgi:hypothetical protein